MVRITVSSSFNGRKYDVEVAPDTRVSSLEATLAPLTGMPPSDMLLVTRGSRLDPGATLSAYGGLAEGATIFLFSREILSMEDPPPASDEQVIVPAYPPPPSAIGSSLLDEASSPLLRALPYYERQMIYHLECGCCVLAASQSRLERSRQQLEVSALPPSRVSPALASSPRAGACDALPGVPPSLSRSH